MRQLRLQRAKLDGGRGAFGGGGGGGSGRLSSVSDVVGRKGGGDSEQEPGGKPGWTESPIGACVCESDVSCACSRAHAGERERERERVGTCFVCVNPCVFVFARMCQRAF